MSLEQWREYGTKLNRYLRPETFPLAVKLFKKDEPIPQGLRKPRAKLGLCTLFNVCRRTGESLWGATGEIYCFGPALLGMMDCEEQDFWDFCEMEATGMFHPMYTDKVEAARNYMHNLPRLPKGTFNALACSPLEWTRVEPDLVVVYGNAVQIWRLAMAVIWNREHTLIMDAKICADDAMCICGLVPAMLTGDPQFVLPGYGERVVSYVLDNELAWVIPGQKLPAVVDALEKSFKSRQPAPVRLPIPYMFEKDQELVDAEARAFEKLFKRKEA